jgi:hypothetical protein
MLSEIYNNNLSLSVSKKQALLQDVHWLAALTPVTLQPVFTLQPEQLTCLSVLENSTGQLYVYILRVWCDSEWMASAQYKWVCFYI